LQLFNDFTAHQLQIVRQISKAAQKDQLCEKVEASIRNDFGKGIIEQHAVTRESTADNKLLSLGRSVEQIPEFRQKMLKIAIHGKDETPACDTIPIRKREANTVRRCAIDRSDQRVVLSKPLNDLSRIVFAIVVNQNDNGEIFISSLWQGITTETAPRSDSCRNSECRGRSFLTGGFWA